MGTLERVNNLPTTPPPSVSAPGLWTTPVRGRVALSALGWVLVYVAGVVVVVIGVLFAASRLGTPRPDTALAALAATAVHLLRRRGLTWADLGLRSPDRSSAHLLWQIPAVMIAGITASALVLTPFGASDDPGGEAIGEDALGTLLAGGPALAVLGLLTVAVVVPIAEEVVFRGIVLPALRARYRAAVGITLAGALFAVVHLVPPALPYLLVVGIALCAMAEWYRSIVPGIVLHGVNNAIVSVGLLVAA